jgi:5-methylcytosine-specific restriction endonuclease McrA
VVSLKSYVAQDRPPAFTRFNLFLRDAFDCQYCGSEQDLTFDHLIPRSRRADDLGEHPSRLRAL